MKIIFDSKVRHATKRKTIKKNLHKETTQGYKIHNQNPLENYSRLEGKMLSP